MKPITLPMAELKPALTGLGKLINRSNTLPVLKNIKIERTAEGWIALTATDPDAFATVRLEQPVEGEPFAIMIPHEDLARTVKTCAKDENILIAPGDKDTGFIQYGLGTQLAEIQFESLPVADFPETPRIIGDAIPLPAAMRASIHEAMECSSTDCTRLILNGVCIDVSNPEAHYVVGTDGRHLFSSNSFALPLKESLVIPNHKFLEWPVFNADGEWQLKVGTAAKDQRTPFQITSRRWRFISHPHEGNFPNWRQVIPGPGNIKTAVDLNGEKLESLLQTIQRMPCHDSKNGTIGIANTGGKFHLLGKSTATADWMRVAIDDASCTGIDQRVFLNRELLKKALGFGLTRIELSDHMGPLRFSSDGRQMIVMPVRADASRAPAKAAPNPTPASQEAQPNTPPSPAEQPKEETTMPKEINGTTNANGAPSRTGSTEPKTEEPRPALDLALAQIEVVRGDFRNAIAGVNKLGDLLKQVQREQKSSEKEVQSVRQTLRSLQGVRI